MIAGYSPFPTSIPLRNNQKQIKRQLDLQDRIGRKKLECRYYDVRNIGDSRRSGRFGF
jgi:hypothetical protein